MTESRPPFPPFTLETAIQKVRMAEDSWNTCDPEKVSLGLGYAPNSRWRNRSEFVVGRPACSASGCANWLPPDQGTLGIHRKPYRRPLRLRVA
jgi:nuclear transport factor 2 (NTF2) superfamily protein